MAKIKPVIFGLKGKTLSKEEREFLELYNPLGIILFSRNIDHKDQVKNLVQSIRTALGRGEAPILIDQEGGRVCRLKEPHWTKPPAISIYGKMAEFKLEDAILASNIHGKAMGLDLAALGINVNCAPVLDVPVEGAHDVIGNRAFSTNKEIIHKLGQAMADGLTESGVVPIMKHIPGHGRAMADSHLELPTVDSSVKTLENSDFYPFRKMQNIDWAMTAHIVYEALDIKHPATTSKTVVNYIREKIGFKGLLISDCITMKALKGDIPEKTKSTFDAGVDIVIHSHGSLNEMISVANSSPDMTEAQIKLVDNSISKTKIHHSSNETSTDLFKKLFSLIDTYNLTEVTGNIYDPTEQLFK